MSKDIKPNRFSTGDLVALTHSVNGLHENTIVRVVDATKKRGVIVEPISASKRKFKIKTDYLCFIKKNRVSTKFQLGDDAIVVHHYGRFLGNSTVKILSNYLGTNNRLVVIDERNIMGMIPEALLRHIN